MVCQHSQQPVSGHLSCTVGSLPNSTDLIVKYLDQHRGRARYQLAEPLVVHFDLDGGEIHIQVPQGFTTDFASIPRFFWRVLPPSGPWLVAAVVHDFLYSTHCSRFLADALFRTLMTQSGVILWRRVLTFYAVRIFGTKAGPKTGE